MSELVSIRSSTPRTFLFVGGTAILVVAIALGVYQSLRSVHRLPPVSLAEIIDAHREEMERLVQARDYAEAEAELRGTLALLNTDRHVYHDLLGRVFLAQPARLDEAVAEFNEALRLRPDFVEARNNLAVAYARQGKMDQALAEVREALRLDPDFEPARQNLVHMRERVEGATPPGPAASATGGDGLDLAAGRSYVKRFYRGELEALRGSFSDLLASQMSLDALHRMQTDVERQLGPETGLLGERIVPGPNFKLYVRRARFEKHAGDVEVLIQLTDDRLLAGLQFRPAEPESTGN